MKKAVFLLLAVVLFFAFGFFSSAEGITVKDFLSESGADGLYHYESGLTPENLGEKISFSSVVGFLFDAFKKAFSEESGFLALIVALVLASAFFGALKSGFLSLQTESVINVAVMSAVVLVTSRGFSSMCLSAENAVNEICTFTKTLIPVVSTLILSSGRPAAAAATEGFLFLSCEVVTFLTETVAVPAVGLYFALSVARALSPAVDLSGICAVYRKAVILFLGLTSACFTVVMSIQSVISAGGDSALKNGVKAAALGLIPAVGGQIRQTVDAFFGCAEAASSLTGAFGVAVVAYIAVAPIITLLVRYAVMRLSSATAKMFGSDRLSECLSDLAGGFSMMTAATVSAAACSVTCLTVMTAVWKG